MKRAVIIVIVLTISQLATSQVVFEQSDSVDAVAWKWLNKYRAHYHLPPVIMDTTIRKSESRRISNKWADSINTCKPFYLKHEEKLAYQEVLTISPIMRAKLINDTTSEFAKFVQTVFKTKISELTGIDFVILESLYNFDTSPRGHREIIRSTKYKIGYFSIVYYVNRPYQLKKATSTDEAAQSVKYFGYKDGGRFVRYTYAATIQFNIEKLVEPK